MVTIAALLFSVLTLEEVDRWDYGPVVAVETDGRYIYINRGAVLLTLDGQNDYEVVSEVGLASPLLSLELFRGRLVGCGAEGVSLFDLSDPAKPSHVSTASLNGAQMAVADGKLLYVVAGYYFYVYTLGRKAKQLIERSSYYLYGLGVDIAARDGRVVTLADSRYVAVYEVERNNYLSYSGGYYLQEKNGDIVEGAPDALMLKERKRVWVAVGGKGVYTVDISSPFNPKTLGKWESDLSFWAGEYHKGKLYLAAGNGGVVVLDAKKRPKELQRVGVSATGLTVGEGGLYSVDAAGGGLYVHALKGWKVGKLLHNQPGYSACINVAFRPEGLLWAACSQDGARLFNAADGRLEEIARIDTDGSVQDVAFAGETVCLADYDGGLLVATGSAASGVPPSVVGRLETPGRAVGVDILGGVAAVADEEGLLLADVANPRSPKRLSYLPSPDITLDVVLKGSYAYVADNLSGLTVVDISDPADPKEAGFYDTPGRAVRLVLAGDTLYVADAAGGLLALSVEEPHSPMLLWAAVTTDACMDVALAGGLCSSDAGQGVVTAEAKAGVSCFLPGEQYGLVSFNTAGDALGVATGRGYIAVADYQAGLVLLRPKGGK